MHWQGRASGSCRGRGVRPSGLHDDRFAHGSMSNRVDAVARQRTFTPLAIPTVFPAACGAVDRLVPNARQPDYRPGEATTTRPYAKVLDLPPAANFRSSRLGQVGP